MSSYGVPEEDPAAATPISAETQQQGAKNGRLPLPLLAAGYACVEICLLISIAVSLGVIYLDWILVHPIAPGTHLRLASAIALLVVTTSALQGTYGSEQLHAIAEHPDRLAMTFTIGFLLLIIILFVSKTSVNYSRAVIVGTMIIGFFVIQFTRRAFANFLRKLTANSIVKLPKVMLIGIPKLLRQFPFEHKSFLQTHALVANVEINSPAATKARQRELTHTRSLVQRLAPDRIVLCVPWSDRDTIRDFLTPLAELPSAVHLDSDASIKEFTRWANAPDHGPLGLTLVRPPLTKTQIASKRAFDIVAALAALIILSPLLLIVAMAIKFDSRGPVLFRQRRYGYGRMPFQVYKFRSMSEESSRQAFQQATRGDKRVTRVGHIIRKTSIDELPQLLNVLDGSMSLVGPRPHPVELDEQFDPLIDHYARRHKIKPGITGWAQVNGHRGETTTTAQMRQRIEHDLYYINNWSFWLDLKILIATVFVVVTRQNAF